MSLARVLRPALLAAACLVALLVAAPAAGDPAPPADTPVVPGEVVVALEPGASPGMAGLPQTGVLRQRAASVVTVAVPPGHEREYAAMFERRDGVRFAQPNYLYQPSFVPDDPDYVYQWNMRMVQAEQAWDVTRGEGVLIAVLDTGVAFEDFGDFGRSPELADALFVFPLDTASGDDHPNDDNGHGTHVTGTLVQDTDNGVQTAGLVPMATILPVKVCLPFGCSGEAMAEGIRWAVDRGADIINMSLGGPDIGQLERDALAYAEEHGVIVVAAAGNGHGDFIGDPYFDYPAAIETVIAVGALDIDANRTRYSNYGEGEDEGGLFIMAPGGNNHADLNKDGFGDGVLQNSYYHSCKGGVPDFKVFTGCFYNGTSMATPHVSGVAAMILSRYPLLTPPEVRAVLACSAFDLGPPGEDEEYGVGVVQAAAALLDSDEDGTPNCLEQRPQLQISIGGGPVEPDAEITVAIKGVTDGHSIGSYDLAVAFDPEVIELIDCQPLPEGECEVTDESVRISGDESGGLSGGFTLGKLTFAALAEAGVSTVLDLSGAAGGVSVSDPPAVVTAYDAVIKVQNVPETVQGDVNCDGQVSLADVVLALRYRLAIASAFCAAYGDIDCSGLLEETDILALLQFLAEVTPTLPAGCPNPVDLPPTPTP